MTYGVALEPVGDWTEAAAPYSLLSAIQNEQVVQGAVKVGYYQQSGSATLDLVQTTVGGAYEVPHSAPAFISGGLGYQGALPLGAFLTGNGADSAFGFVPSTSSMTGHGLPGEKFSSLQQAPATPGIPDGVSRTGTAQPATPLITLATPGRDPADITIPTQAGTQGSGGPPSSGSNLRPSPPPQQLTFAGALKAWWNSPAYFDPLRATAKILYTVGVEEPRTVWQNTAHMSAPNACTSPQERSLLV